MRIPPRSSHSLRQAVALASGAGLALVALTCGGKFVVDPPLTNTVSSGSGGSAGAGGSPGAGAGEPSGDAGCPPLDAAPPAMAMQGCFPSSFCPPPDTQSVMEQLDEALGLCDTAAIPCCGEPVIDQVVCGPAGPPNAGCCYTLLVSMLQCPGG